MKDKISIAGPELRKVLKGSDPESRIRELFRELHPFEIFSLIEGMEYDEIAAIIQYIRFPKAAELFEYFDEEEAQQIFHHFDRKNMIRMIEEMSSDDRVDLLKILDESLVQSLMPLIAQAERNDIINLIEYEEETAGAIMTSEYASLKGNMTAREGLDQLKRIAPDKETIYTVYITDENRKLIGVLSLKKLIVSPDKVMISDIMDRDFVSVHINDDQEFVSKVIADYDILSVPVVDENMKLFGIVTVDDIVDVVIEEDTEDFLRHGSVTGEENYLSVSPFRLAKQRIVWLLLLVLVGFISGYVMEMKQHILESVIALAFFLPLINGSAGNAGTQSSTIIIRGLATGELEIGNIMKILVKEIATGIIIGILLGLAAGLRAIIMNHDPSLAITVGLSMVIVVLTANILGALFPILFKKMKLDPALMSAPFIASVIDILSIFIYLTLAGIVFNI
ncbi:MAG: magnesium transporter [candidate division WOR-3 bacterium]|nr:magnesium transporter [candidate division WOR-3 bacterium]